jgi:threonine dehydratase
MALHIATPLLESAAYGTPDRRVWLKMEALQPSGSFKMRGVGHACETHVRRGAKRLMSSSGGNAGLAVAHAGRALGVPVTVVVPQSTGLKPDAVVLSVGGGGLMCGVIEGLHRHGWVDVPVIAVETQGADSLAQSVAAGERVELPAITSIATSLGARQVCAQAFDWTRRHPVRSVVVSDREAVEACLSFALEQRVIVEPACGAALSQVFAPGASTLRDARNVLVIVCGGVAASHEQLQAWSKEFAAA